MTAGQTHIDPHSLNFVWMEAPSSSSTLSTGHFSMIYCRHLSMPHTNIYLGLRRAVRMRVCHNLFYYDPIKSHFGNFQFS